MENAEVADDLIQGKPDEDGFKTRRKEPQGKQFSAKGNVTSRLTVPPFKKKPFAGSKAFAGNRSFNTGKRPNAENQRLRPSFSRQRQGFKRHFTGKTIEERKALRDAKKCYICEEEEHFANECPQRNSQNKDDKSDRKGKKPKPSARLVPDLVAVDIEYHRSMFELHQRVNPKEVIVGWYSTSAGVSGSDALIQDFYAREATNPVYLTVDTTFQDESASIKAFVSTALSLGDRQLAAQFHEVQLDLRMVEAERVGFDVLKKTIVEKLPDDLEALETSMLRLQSMIDSVFKYVEDVIEGRSPPDNAVGRYLADTIASIPKISPDAFDRLFNDSIQDLLLVLYLANLTRTQLSLAKKLNSAAQIF
ncbi:hypothetical protein L7F22_017620 [Adiantum nelumboides]|nr:hypothetical protein [Adiantum nelumboides]